MRHQCTNENLTHVAVHKHLSCVLPTQVSTVSTQKFVNYMWYFSCVLNYPKFFEWQTRAQQT